MNILTDFFLRGKNFLFPRSCALCGSGFTDVSEIRTGLCSQCASSFSPVKGNKCNLCGKPLISESGLCTSCRKGESHSYDQIRTLFPYCGKYRALLTEYKFNGNLALADFLAQKVLDILRHPLLVESVIVPVPARPGKIKESGWDQVEYLVRRILKLSKGGVSVCRCLVRKKSKTQKTLDRAQRLENLKGRIKVRGTVPKNAIVIDDVITTGSTLEVCSAVLKEHGAQKVYGLCLFYN
jgi:ComF family protein